MEVLEEGLPEGSSLSSTLFLIYIHNLATQIKAENTLYADDLVKWLSHENVHSAAHRLNNDLQRLNKYCLTWKQKVNTDKTVYTIFTKSQKVAKHNIDQIIDKQILSK
jgi:hypothetical protein